MGYNEIALLGIHKSFGEGDSRSPVLHEVSLALPTGEICLIVGPSGCGKTTLISIMGGILRPDAGEVQLFGHAIQSMSDLQKAELRQQHVGFIFQQFNLVNTLNLTENVAIPLLIQGVPERQALRRAQEMLTSVGLGEKLNQFPIALSGGQQQRVAIARALVNNPRLIICDEPTSALDGHTGQQVMDLLQTVAYQAGRSVVIVTHDSRIHHYAHRIVEMEDGRIAQIRTGKAAKALPVPSVPVSSPDLRGVGGPT